MLEFDAREIRLPKSGPIARPSTIRKAIVHAQMDIHAAGFVDRYGARVAESHDVKARRLRTLRALLKREEGSR